MKITNIKIEKLFGRFDYNINLDQEDDITILTGPNGYGKTTILNIIYNLFNFRFFYFQKLKFERITIDFTENKSVIINKKNRGLESLLIENIHNNSARFNIVVELKENESINSKYTYDTKAEKLFLSKLKDYIDITSGSNFLIKRIDFNEVEVYNFLNENQDNIPNEIFDSIKGVDSSNKKLFETINAHNVYLIKEQRLISINQLSNEGAGFKSYKNTYLKTIEAYANEFKKLIEEKQLEAYTIAQQLDSSFPKRLISMQESEALSEEEFKERYLKLAIKQKQLQKLGITFGEEDSNPEYDDSSANVLTVYLQDSEKKIRVYDELLEKINLFENILNEKRFAFKEIIIDKTKGFYFQTDTKDILNLSDLSSGEQHEVVLLYQLLFKTEPNTLILIDEPEISLHVMWQKAFIADLQKIGEINKTSFLIATHSPQIINNSWDLARDLYELSENKQ